MMVSNTVKGEEGETEAVTTNTKTVRSAFVFHLYCHADAGASWKLAGLQKLQLPTSSFPLPAARSQVLPRQPLTWGTPESL